MRKNIIFLKVFVRGGSILGLALLLLNFCFVSLSWAGLRIDKPKIRISVAPGGYDGGEITVENTDVKGSLGVRVYLEDWVYSQQDGAKDFMPKGTTPLSCSDWISFYPADFTLSPGGTQVVRFTVNVPEDAKGGYFSVMFFETGGGEMETVNEEGQTAIIKILNRLGALFYVEPQGTIDKSAEIKNLDVMLRLNSLIVTGDFFNTGNTNITAKGTLDIIDSQGLVYGRGTINEVYTLPKGKAVLSSTIPSIGLKPGSYDMLMTIEFENGGTLVKEVSFEVSGSGVISSITPKD